MFTVIRTVVNGSYTEELSIDDAGWEPVIYLGKVLRSEYGNQTRENDWHPGTLEGDWVVYRNDLGDIAKVLHSPSVAN